MESLRKTAIDHLRRYGISGTQVYLIDLIPLIEIMWADGKAQEGELLILGQYLEEHVAYINSLAGCEILTLPAARAFIEQYLHTRPDPELLKCLRDLVSPVRLSASDAEANRALKTSLLSACLDIAASSVTRYPYGIGERFDPAEKRCFFEILESLLGLPPAQCPPTDPEQGRG